jgi:O-antigen/teichoic acid export membrane protein
MFKPAMTIMAGRTLGYVALFVLPLILVRWFDQEAFGTYKQVFLLYGTILALAQLGMSESLFFFLPGAERDGGRYVANTIIVLGGVGLIIAAGLVAGAETIAGRMNNPALAPLMPLLAGFFLLMVASYVLEIIMTARHEYGTAAVSYGLSDVVRALMILVPVLIFHTLASLLYGAILFAVIRLGTTLWYCWKQFGRTLRPEWTLLGKQVAYCLPFALYVLFQTGQDTLHQYVVSSMFDAATFAVYSVGCLQVPLVEVVSSSVVNVMMVGMVQAIREGRESAVLSMWYDTVRKLALVFFPLVALLLITAHDLIIFLFTDGYTASVPIFRAWTLAILLAVFPIDGLLRVYAKTPFLLGINVVRLAIVAGGMYWFVAGLGLVGAVLITMVALAVGKAMGLGSMMRSWRVGPAKVAPWRDLAAIGAAATAASVPTVWVASQLAATPLARLSMLSLIYGGVYGALAWSFGLIRKTEQDALLRWVQPLSLSRFRLREL